LWKRKPAVPQQQSKFQGPEALMVSVQGGHTT
jgi:hypothetical protein